MDKAYFKRSQEARHTMMAIEANALCQAVFKKSAHLQAETCWFVIQANQKSVYALLERHQNVPLNFRAVELYEMGFRIINANPDEWMSARPTPDFPMVERIFVTPTEQFALPGNTNLLEHEFRSVVKSTHECEILWIAKELYRISEGMRALAEMPSILPGYKEYA